VSTTDKDLDTERKGNRLSKIVTRTGDAGTTGLGDGSRTTKDSLRIDAIGEVDELNSSLGLLLCEELPEDVRAAADSTCSTTCSTSAANSACPA
jgi:cob(I)alamin adenosyltransferase